MTDTLNNIDPSELMGAMAPIMELTACLTRIESHLAYQSASLATLAGHVDENGNVAPGLMHQVIAEGRATNAVLTDAMAKFGSGPLGLLRGGKS